MLALLIGIALPIACLTALTAVTTYRTVTGAIEAGQLRTVDDYVVRTQLWNQATLKSLLASGPAFARADGDQARCDAVAAGSLAQIQDYRAFSITSQTGSRCVSSRDPAIGAADLAAAIEKLRSKSSGGEIPASGATQARYDYLTVAGRTYLALYASNLAGNARMGEGLLLIEPTALDQVFDLGDKDGGLAVAFVKRGGNVIASRDDPGGKDAVSWLPETELVPDTTTLWRASSRAGEDRDFAARAVSAPDFYIVASFDDAPGRAARTQFLVLLLAPLLTLALLCVVYLRAIDRHCIRWLRGIEAAARARSSQTPAHAAIAADMPVDIRSVAEAFNTMVDEQEVRRRKLQAALNDNRFLVRELHHRVKNSLQVVQSYIGLTKRDHTGAARLALADAECHVHVLSAAYRFTLADGEMQPVRLGLFAEDVVTMIVNLLRGRDQTIIGTIETEAHLSVDRIIPLGFLIVDVVSRALRTTPGVGVHVTLRDVEPRTVEIIIEADREVSHTTPPKLFAGLLSQIEAVQVASPQGRSLGAWRISHLQ